MHLFRTKIQAHKTQVENNLSSFFRFTVFIFIYVLNKKLKIQLLQKNLV